MAITARKAVFLDKDGTLIEDVPYNVDPARIRLEPGAAHALRLLAAAGFGLCVITNQSGVARGYFPEPALAAVADRLRALFDHEGVRLLGFAYCPHHPEGSVRHFARPCECRKPRPGLIHALARCHGFDLARSWVVGDILDDIEAGSSAGCRTVLVDNGHEDEWRTGPGRQPHHTAPDILSAAAIISKAPTVVPCGARE